MVKKDLGKSKSKHENALAILKLWEEELNIKNEVNEVKVYPKDENDSVKIYDSKC